MTNVVVTDASSANPVCVSRHQPVRWWEYPLAIRHYVLLERNLLYTGLTRARKLAVIVCMETALRRALRNASANRRYTRLGQRLTETISAPSDPQKA